MTALIALGIAFLVLGVYIIVLRVEKIRGARFFERQRSQFDVLVRRSSFVIAHVDFSSFTWTLVKESLLHLTHLVLQSLLVGTRSIERLLTRTVRGIRATKAESPRENNLAKTADIFKKVFARTIRFSPHTKKNIASSDAESSPRSLE